MTPDPDRPLSVVAASMGGPDVEVDITIATTEPLAADIVTLVLADAAQLMQTVRRHTTTTPPAPAPLDRRPPAYTRLPEAFDGKRS